MKFAKYISNKRTPQSMPIPGSNQIRNSAGGYTWAVDPWQLLDRFLILGTEGGTYYIQEQKLTLDNARNAIACIEQDGHRAVNRIVEISKSGRAPKNDAAIFALALAASTKDADTRKAALEAMPLVCRTGTHLFQFASEVEELRGWGRGLRSAVGRWYNQADPVDLTYQAIKYQQRGGWSHRDLLRLAHPKPKSEAHGVLYKWIVDDELVGKNDRLAAFCALKETNSVEEASQLIRDYDMPRECVPTGLLTEPVIWEALMENMPMTAMIRNLANMTRVGLLTPGSAAARKVIAELQNPERIRKARVHPLTVLLALATYRSGQGFRGSGTWSPVPRIVDALDDAFVLAFENVVPTGKRYLLGMDVSGSMSSAFVGNSPLSACEAATAMALVTMRSEEAVTPMAFADRYRELKITPKMSLAEAMRHTSEQNFGRTDCALPMVLARTHRIPVDVFVIYTDNETWAGTTHPSRALVDYRQATGIGAKLIVVGMTSNGFSIADPNDPGMLDVVGFDSSVPQAMSEFAIS